MSGVKLDYGIAIALVSLVPLIENRDLGGPEWPLVVGAVERVVQLNWVRGFRRFLPGEALLKINHGRDYSTRHRGRVRARGAHSRRGAAVTGVARRGPWATAGSLGAACADRGLRELLARCPLEGSIASCRWMSGVTDVGNVTGHPIIPRLWSLKTPHLDN